MKHFTVKKKSRFPYITQVCLILLFLIFFSHYLDHFSDSSKAQEKQILERALTRCITQCYAMEGCYPEDLTYLTEHYGLTYNHKNFLIDYQYIGGNLRPDVTIIERK